MVRTAAADIQHSLKNNLYNLQIRYADIIKQKIKILKNY